MARCSNITSANLQFPFSISIVQTIAVFIFEKKKNVSKNKGRREVKTCLKHGPLRCKRVALINSKPEPNKVNQLVLTCSKSGPAKKKEEPTLTCPKLELKWRRESDSNELKTWVTKDRRMLQNFRFQAFKILFLVFCKFLSMCNLLYAMVHSKPDSLILAWLFFNFCLRM